MKYYDKALEFDALYRAMKKCCRNLRWKDSVTGYEANGLRNTYLLRQDLLNGSYKIRPYQHFTIYEPKKREIVATRFRDRQFQMSLCESGAYQDFVEHLISESPACQKGKGNDYTLNKMTAHLRRYYLKHGAEGWVLKLDIRKFFPSTRHDIACEASRKHLSDADAAERICEIINSFGGDKGMGLGSQISQLVELAVLDDLDHFIKERLKIKYYVRYMDDMVLIHHDKEYLRFCLKEISRRLEKLGFELNEKTQIYPLRHGVRLMNWSFMISSSGKIVRKMSKNKLGRKRRKLKKLIEKEACGELEEGTAEESLRSFLANMERGNTYYQRRRLIAFYKSLKGVKKNESKH